ncbi:unnamed protein product [Adineta steineri]|uniref:PDZ domain-containing protein n=1 Tax=Adineta steineri TaxID=433720 RepID=A0A813RLR2_9BILA|nr:unnamed protein product [Adineta steineri]
MSIFDIFKRKKKEKDNVIPISSSYSSATTTTTSPNTTFENLPPSKRRSSNKSSNNDKRIDQSKLVFHCQLAHGSPTGLMSGFGNLKELYQKIADCFEIPASTILYCTLNTHKVDMDKLLSGQINLDDFIFAHVKGQAKEIEVIKSEPSLGLTIADNGAVDMDKLLSGQINLDDFIFAHVKGQAKEIEVIKSEPSLGLTIADNGAGCAFVKRIVEGSTMHRLKNLVKIGDHIEKINDKSIVGVRHFEVANVLKNIPVGSKIKIRLIEPNSFGFHIEPANRGRKSGDVKSGTKTLRFKADGKASIEDVDDTMIKAIDRINGLLEKFMGINDSDLAQQIWDLAQNKKNPSEFATAIDNSEIGTFNFSDEFIFDLWATIDDIKQGRIKQEKIKEEEEEEEEEEDFQNERL